MILKYLGPKGLIIWLKLVFVEELLTPYSYFIISNFNSIHYVNVTSHCNNIAPLIKKRVVHTLYMKATIENSGNLTLFLKDGRSDDIYYHSKTVQTKGENIPLL